MKQNYNKSGIHVAGSYVIKGYIINGFKLSKYHGELNCVGFSDNHQRELKCAPGFELLLDGILTQSLYIYFRYLIN